ncbi:lytic transglycosylase domain-containing protein [Pikeienuella piscinae]|uniref:Lytic transglycosylase domain-containing protein n=1 Tax=Pikeienuella piscinae TaxID=2748098 RepID=A0A7L5C2B9_9RHOB|nr:lytic transglycosylase domain-containing protein [Pikeienuella piscinae]QIE56987.1 lytic transglycosylase domain-containing protein [Pikeienuella piscinae]
MWRLALLLALIAAPVAASQRPAADIAAICDEAARIGASASEAPLEILRALTRTETGRRLDGAFRPWPWTVNMEGEGFWFETREEALAFVRARRAAGARSFDIGCFQINFRWHGGAFESIEAMFDPALNARYAAKFLDELKSEGGGWRAAVGRYHSRTPEFARRYSDRFETILASLSAVSAAPTIARGRQPLGRDAWPPLFQGGPAGAAGGVFVAPPAHGEPARARANWRGGIALDVFTAGAGLLRPVRPLFD